MVLATGKMDSFKNILRMKNLFVFCIIFLASLGLFAQQGLSPEQIENNKKKEAFMSRLNDGWKPAYGNFTGSSTDQPKTQVFSIHPKANYNYANTKAAPTNDACMGAAVLGVTGICKTGQTTLEANPDVSGGCATGDLSVWYTITLTGTNNYVDITFQNETMGGDVELFLFTGSCASLSGFQAQCDVPSTTFNFDGLVSGTTYYLQVSNAAGDEGNFDICAVQGYTPPGVLTGPEQDCDGAIPICAGTFSEINSYTGYGSTQEIGTTCLLGDETNSVWYTFTIQDISGGTTLGFSISTTKDYDFALYDITSIGCAGIPSATPVRCNFSATLGATGLNSASTSTTLPALSQSAMGTPTMNGLSDVYVGQTFALIIDNWSADNNGYTITFTGGAKLFDNTAPTLSLVDDCYSNSMYVNIDENILCTSIQNGEFRLYNTDNTTDYSGNITSVTGLSCSSGDVTSQIVLGHDGTMPSGNYELEIMLGELEDLCGNKIPVGDLLTFQHLGDVSISPSVSDICNAGDPVTLTAMGQPVAGATFAWSPGIAGTTSSVVVNPASSTTYNLSVTYGGCTKTDNQVIEVADIVIAAINPMNPQICSGTTLLTASTTINGSNCASCTYLWSSGETTAAITKGAGTYTVTVTTSSGCPGDNNPASTISLASSGSGTNCYVYYVDSYDGTVRSGETKDAPTSLLDALSKANCTSATIKMAKGIYTFTDRVSLSGPLTIEGGFSSDFTTKSSDMSGGANSTTIRRANTADSDEAAACSAFKVAANSTSFRFQDLRIEMPGNVAGTVTKLTSGSGISSYGIKMGANCSGYNIVRCYIDGGRGANP